MSKPGRTRHIHLIHRHIPVILNGPRDESPTAASVQSDQDGLNPLRPEDIQEEDADAPELMDFDLAMPQYHPSTPVAPDFDNTSIGRRSASIFSSPLPKFNDVHSDQGTQSSIGSTTCHPVVNGKWCDKHCQCITQ
jgi:hypothetical protein